MDFAHLFWCFYVKKFIKIIKRGDDEIYLLNAPSQKGGASSLIKIISQQHPIYYLNHKMIF